MHRTTSLLLIFLLAALVLVLQLYGLHLYLYWTYWWFDIVMHGLGGLLIGMSALWYVMFERKASSSLFVATAATFFVGVVWEIFEYVTGISLLQNNWLYSVDTSMDLVMDVVGGCIAYLLCSRLWRVQSQ